MNASLSVDLGPKSYIEVDMKIDRFVPYHIKCPVCGTKCAIKIPVLEKEIDINLPPCPIKSSSIDKSFHETLPESAPEKIRVRVDGEVKLVDDSGTNVVRAKVSGALE